MYRIDLEDTVIEELAALPAYDRARVADAIDRHLKNRPKTESKAVKFLVSVRPPWSDQPGTWQLKVEPYRIFYDVDETQKMVMIQAVRRKGRQKTEDILK